VNSDPHWWQILWFGFVRWFLHEALPWLIRESWLLVVAALASIAAFAKSVYRWLQDTDWELMVNRIFPRKKDRPKRS
jgi:hypothetical protein